MVNQLKPDKAISELMLISILSTVAAIAIAPKSSQKDWLIPFLSGISVASAVQGYRKNEQNKNTELYLNFVQESQDHQFADSVTINDLIESKKKEIELTAKLAQLEELKLNVESRLAEFE